MRISLALLLVAALAGCAAPAPREAGTGLTRAEALAGAPILGAGPLPPLPEVDILALDAPMRAFLERHVDAGAGARRKLRQLVAAIVDTQSFGLRYGEATRTAAATFAAHDGNCLSFANLFVALAREAGLGVRYQQIDIPPDWEQRGDSFVLNRHVNVLVALGVGSEATVDFDTVDVRTGYAREPVPDRRAQAYYYSNIGVERMHAGDLHGAFLYLRRGLQSDAGFAPLWINLGALYVRANAPRHAEASYREALAIDAADMVAISGLARLYERLGDAARAAHYRDLAVRHRENNPYYRFHRANTAFAARDWAAALAHLDFAIRRKPEEDAFHFLRARVYAARGDARRARAELERAESLAADEATKIRYREQREEILSGAR